MLWLSLVRLWNRQHLQKHVPIPIPSGQDPKLPLSFILQPRVDLRTEELHAGVDSQEQRVRRAVGRALQWIRVCSWSRHGSEGTRLQVALECESARATVRNRLIQPLVRGGQGKSVGQTVDCGHLVCAGEHDSSAASDRRTTSVCEGHCGNPVELMGWTYAVPAVPLVNSSCVVD